MKKIHGVILILFFGLQACTNITQTSGRYNLNTNGNPAFISTASALSTHTLKNVILNSVAATGANSVATLELTLAVDTGLAGFQSLTGFCGLTQSNACSCEMKWVQNTANGDSFNRTVRLPVTAVQSGLVKCSMTQTVWDEIASGTIIGMNIVPGSSNTSGLVCSSINYKKGTVVAANGDFLDSTLTPFRNVHRYACHTKRKNAYEITNKYGENIPVGDVDASGNRIPKTVYVGSQFCTGAAGGSGGNANGGGTGGSFKCDTPRSGYSAQNYYRNFYVKSDTQVINASNNTYDCPKVLEPIKYSATSSGGLTTIPSSEQSKLWPFDATFALATTYSPDWSVGVSSASRLYVAGNPSSSTSHFCQGEPTTDSLVEPGIVRDCIGYAKKPNANGTCGTIQDNNGRIRPLVRLRRYRAILPPTFQPDGRVSQTNLNADEVYIADRLVVDQQGIATGEMIYGPKPCNYAWFDHEGMLKRNSAIDFLSNFNAPGGFGPYANPSYVSTQKYYRNNSGVWTPELSVNPDGEVFPNLDFLNSSTGITAYSCSATLPRIKYSMGQAVSLQLLTSHKNRNGIHQKLDLGPLSLNLDEIHLQPVDPWVPNYVEDTSFQACAPVADPYLEPPMHFYKDAANNYAWCSKTYPTQNPYWGALNKKRKTMTTSTTLASTLVNFPVSARVTNFTSHINSGAGLDSHNTCTGTLQQQICTMTLGTGSPDYASCLNYLGVNRVNEGAVGNTCDRTVISDPFREYFDFPLQAKDADIASMLQVDLAHDKTYACMYSVSSDAAKVNKQYPSSGCCGVVSGVSVLSGIQGAGVKSGHLEPLINPALPDIRFCGSPVR